MENAIRVLVANRPKLMRELILEALDGQPGIEVVGEVSDDSEILDHVRKTQPDLLIIALDEPGKRPEICDLVFREHPVLRIVAVASDQNHSACYWASLNIHSNSFEPSEESFLNAVRSVTKAAIHLDPAHYSKKVRNELVN